MRARPRPYYGWWIVLASTLAMALSSGTSFWTFGVYIDPLEEEFGWTRTQLSGAVSGSLVVSGLVGPLVGAAVDRYGARLLILVGAILTGGCYLLLGSISELWHFYAINLTAAFFRPWMFYIPFNSLLTRWFDRRRGMAIGIANAGFGLGGAAFVPFIAFIIEQWGWRQAYATSGVILIAILAPLALLVIRSRPEEMGLSVDGVAPEPVAPTAPQPREASRSDGSQWTVATATRTAAFWLLALAFMLFFGGRISFLVHTVPFYISRGIGDQQAAQLVGYAAILAVVARLGFSIVVDRVPSIRLTAVGMALMHTAAVVLVTATTEPFALGLFVLLWGVASGSGPMLEPLLISKTFGVANFGAILGAMGMVETLGMLVAPIVGGAIFDARGSYDVAFLLYAAIFALSALFFLVFRPPRPAATAEAVGEARA
ncbi:MAG: MFS transporter [Dehalococcoidia bacterium]